MENGCGKVRGGFQGTTGKNVSCLCQGVPKKGTLCTKNTVRGK